MFYKTVSAICYTLCMSEHKGLEKPYGDVTKFVLSQIQAMDWYMVFAMKSFILSLNIYCLIFHGKFFFYLRQPERSSIFRDISNSSIGPIRDFGFFFKGLSLFALLARL